MPKMPEASRETPESIYACFKAVTERLGSSGSWLLWLQGDPDLEPPQPRTS